MKKVGEHDMGRRVLVRIAAAVAVAASLALGTVSTASATGVATAAAADASRGGGGVTPNSKLDPLIKVNDSENLKIVATFRGEGVQIYRTCVNGQFGPAEPAATLEDLRSKKLVGIHGAGPFWASFDGSKVTRDGTVASVLPPVGAPAGVAWLRVPVKSELGQRGIFSNVTVVQRIDTRGGLAPSSCAGTEPIAVNYSTNYVISGRSAHPAARARRRPGWPPDRG
jgi:hypothetical protein